MIVAADSLEDGPLQRSRPVDQFDRPPGLQFVEPDHGELGQGPSWGHDLIVDLGIPHVGPGQILGDHRFDDRDGDAQGDVGSYQSSAGQG